MIRSYNRVPRYRDTKGKFFKKYVNRRAQLPGAPINF